jgi:hypothetical protein
MTNVVFLFAAAQVIDRINPAEAVSPTSALVLKDFLLIIGVGAGLTVILLFWALSSARKRKRHRRQHHSLVPGAAPAAEEGEEPAAPHRHYHHRRRRQREEHRGRNPTLAETGGLPPIRPSSPSTPPV